MQQKQINYKPNDETKTQAPIGNIVYEIDDDENQNIHHSSDAVYNIDGDDVGDKLFPDNDADNEFGNDGDDDDDNTRIGNVKLPMNSRRQQSSKYTDRIDDSGASTQNGSVAQNQQLQRYDGVENGAHQRHHISHAVVTHKPIDRQMKHKNWGKAHENHRNLNYP